MTSYSLGRALNVTPHKAQTVPKKDFYQFLTIYMGTLFWGKQEGFMAKGKKI